MGEGYYKKFKTLTRWQLVAEIAIAKYEEYGVGQIKATLKTKRVKTPLQKPKELKVQNQMKKLTTSERKKIIQDLAIKFLNGEQLIAIIRKLDNNAMYIMRRKSLQIPLDFIMYKALDCLIHIVTSEPVLVPPDTSRQFILEVDASQYAMGAILFQADKELMDR
jgi:hypothetical protein